MTTESVRYELFPMCAAGDHGQCIARYASVLSIDFVQLPAVRCNCDCQHRDQAEREARGDD